MKTTLKLLTVIACIYNTVSFGQTSYSNSITSSGGQNYFVNISITPTAIIPVQSTCSWGYNYDVAYDYNIQIIGENVPSLYTLNGYLTCERTTIL